MVMAAVAMVVVMGAASLSVDIGAVASRKRDVRKVADLAALDATTNLSKIVSDPLIVSKTAAVRSVVEDSAVRNGLVLDPSEPRTAVDVVLGEYLDQVFTACGAPLGVDIIDDATADLAIGSGLCVPNAVRVASTDVAPRYFAFFAEDRTVNAVATAARARQGSTSSLPGTPGTPGTRDNVATISAGSYVARAEVVTDPVLGNPLLPRVLRALLGNTGTNASFAADAISYKGLAAQEIDLETLRGRLVANGDASAGTVDELLDAALTLDALYSAAADAVLLEGGASSAAADLDELASLAAASTTTGTFRFGDLFDIEAGQPGSTGTAEVNVLDLVTSAAQVANGDNLFTIDLAGALPAELAKATVTGTIIEPPVMAAGPVGTRVTTGQVRFQLDLELTDQVPVALLLSSKVKLPVVVEAGNATAQITNIFNPDMADEAQQQVDVSTQTSGAYAGIGQLSALSDLRNALPPSLPQVDMLLSDLASTVSSPKQVTVAECQGELAFVHPFDPSNPGYTQSVGCDPLELPVPLSSPVTDILGSVLGTVLGDVNTAIDNALGPVNQLVDQLTAGFGITVGGADVTIHDVEATTVTGTPAVPGVPGPTVTAEDLPVLVK
jgi:uncharacterized membrane protein